MDIGVIEADTVDPVPRIPRRTGLLICPGCSRRDRLRKFGRGILCERCEIFVGESTRLLERMQDNGSGHAEIVEEKKGK